LLCGGLSKRNPVYIYIYQTNPSMTSSSPVAYITTMMSEDARRPYKSKRKVAPYGILQDIAECPIAWPSGLGEENLLLAVTNTARPLRCAAGGSIHARAPGGGVIARSVRRHVYQPIHRGSARVMVLLSLHSLLQSGIAVKHRDLPRRTAAAAEVGCHGQHHEDRVHHAEEEASCVRLQVRLRQDPCPRHHLHLARRIVLRGRRFGRRAGGGERRAVCA
jgi:hypothetical protein